MDFFNIFGAWSSDSYEGTLIFFFYVPNAPILVPNGPRPPNKTCFRHIYVSFLDFWALFSPKSTGNGFLRHFQVQNCQMPQKLCFSALNLHKMCVSGRIWAELKARNDENTSNYVSRRLSWWSKSILKPKVVLDDEMPSRGHLSTSTSGNGL